MIVCIHYVFDTIIQGVSVHTYRATGNVENFGKKGENVENNWGKIVQKLV